ncbi:SDR family NAD(P)-dependent oxidoreductase [Allobranchiibius sp. GilTou38]|uniref:SDR family NAD(P)-dependent oxidoreductase n=1 Tax=Allobranchiibius sp. GilTou38 TaxID=2815210 RepID=UPI001AA188C0|nr:SDR family NAD(P)-dependent oxidoreductase [Allobranchiibius sp. GilTou38]MBO1765833.1 SDR family NAD(P)-dependent oxidoreductase [Allobranchiibius sp. GilTou38]
MTSTQTPLGSGFGADSTAAQVLEGVDLHGRRALVTGGYSGIGIEGVRALDAAGAQVVVPARRVDEAREALADVPDVQVVPLDLSDLQSVRAAAEGLAAQGDPFDIVIAGAGVMASPYQLVGDGWESQFATNHLGHFALVNRLWPHLADGARVVSVSSVGHHRSGIRWDDMWFAGGYDKWDAYGQSKTANALFALELDRLGADRGIHAYSLHPGGILTPLQRHLPKQEQIAMGWIDEHGTPSDVFKTTEQGAATQIWAATSAKLDDHGGVYCEDCDIAPMADGERRVGVKPWAHDPEQAQRLWQLSAELTGVDAFA